MKFEIIASNDGKSFLLKNKENGTEAEVYAFGALMNRFAIKKDGKLVNAIDSYASPKDAEANITDGFRSAKLSPFVCRLAKMGEFSFEGKNYKTGKTYLNGSAIHGLIFDEEFSLVSTNADDEKAALTLRYKYDKTDEGFPFPYAIEVSYTLNEKNQLTVESKVTNLGNADMPVNDGWHPYFTLGKKIDEMEIRFNSKELVEFDEGLLPNGKVSVYNTFNQFKIFGDTFLDNCFTLNNFTDAAFQMRDKAAGVELSIHPAESYPFLQVYTPPTRKSIAVENLSSVPDSFNNKKGLLVLKPAESKRFSTTYQLTVL